MCYNEGVSNPAHTNRRVAGRKAAHMSAPLYTFHILDAERGMVTESYRGSVDEVWNALKRDLPNANVRYVTSHAPVEPLVRFA
jgi:hypothetical protein